MYIFPDFSVHLIDACRWPNMAAVSSYFCVQLGSAAYSTLTCEETSHRSGGTQTLPGALSHSPVIQGIPPDGGSAHHQISVGTSCRWV